MNEWLAAVVVGVVSGVGSGGLAAYVGRPAAHAAAEEAKARTAHRRDLMSDAQELVTEAYFHDWSHGTVALDERFIAIRKDLSDQVREAYPVKHDASVDIQMPGTRSSHEALRDDLERLAGVWKLS